MNEQRRAFQFALIVTLVLRCITSLVLAVASEVSPIDTCLYKACDPHVFEKLNETWSGNHFLAPWYRWDTVHYLDLANPDYQNLGYEGSIWPPLYPWLIRLFSVILPDMLSALLISTLSCLLLFYLLYREVDTYWGEKAAKKTVILLAVFPTGFFLMAGYTEALFIALSLGVFSQIRAHRWWTAGLFGVLAVLTRHQGIFLCLPIAIQGYVFIRTNLQADHEKLTVKSFLATKKWVPVMGAILMIAAGLSINYCYVHFVIGAPWPWQTYTTYWGRQLSFPGMGLFNMMRLLITNSAQPIYVNMYLDAILFVIFSVSLITTRKQLPAEMFIFGAVVLLFHVSYVSGINLTMDAVSRYLLAVFPCFISLSLLLKSKISYLFCAGLSMAIQIILLYFFYLWMWVA